MQLSSFGVLQDHSSGSSFIENVCAFMRDLSVGGAKSADLEKLLVITDALERQSYYNLLVHMKYIGGVDGRLFQSAVPARSELGCQW